MNKDHNISLYKESVDSTLEKFYKLENRLKPNSRVINMFENQILSIPKFLRNKFKNYSYKLVLFNDKKEWTYEVFPHIAIVKACEGSLNNGSEIRVPVKIFIDSVSMNMFHHSSISKRNKYLFENENLLGKYQEFQRLLEYVELGVFPLKFKYILIL